MKKYLFWGLGAASGVFVYVTAVSWLMYNISNIFGEVDSFLAPLFALLLLVISASITGTLVLGKPISLYLDHHKKESFLVFVSTLSFLFLFAVGLMIVLSLR
ncbi:MAG: hypothetical protein NUV96_01135 [Candidatus Colwellbacteria bacterium]|nr:hypothetical protein [Candidatus Colwellbacteria bacterium]